MSKVVVMTVGPGESDNPIFGYLLNDLRTAKKLSRAEVARRIGITSEYVRLIERGERTPTLGTTITLLDVYEVSYTHTKGRLFFENASVGFTSRIKESRNNPHRNSPKLTRIEMLGEIVEFLALADDDTVKKIHSKLRRRIDVAN